MGKIEDFRIRPADEYDLDQVVQIENESFESPWSKDYFKYELFNPITNFYVIENSKQLVGYVIFWHLMDEFHIANIAVHSQFRKLGLGTTLLNYVIEMALKNKVKSITLEVNEKNQPAINLYQKFGFKPVGRRPKYYENRDDAIIMTLEL